MCPAGPRIGGFRPHFTLTYIKAEKLRPVVHGLAWEYTLRKVSKNDGYRTLSARPLRKWGENSLYIEGPLEEYKRGLRDHLVRFVVQGALGDYRRAHVDVRGDWDRPLYQHLRLLDWN
jgi:hypothetical protein